MLSSWKFLFTHIFLGKSGQRDCLLSEKVKLGRFGCKYPGSWLEVGQGRLPFLVVLSIDALETKIVHMPVNLYGER